MKLYIFIFLYAYIIKYSILILIFNHMIFMPKYKNNYKTKF